MVKEAVVEFHGYRDNEGEFIIKELALVGDNKQYVLIFFKSPFSKENLEPHYYRMADWLEKSFHHIKWEYGDTEFSEETMKILCGYYNTIYTKGSEKVRYLQKFHNNVKQIPDIAPNSKFMFTEEGKTIKCPVHVNNGPCCLHTAIILMDWIRLQCDYVRESVRMETFKHSNIPDNKQKSLAKAGFYFNNEKNRVICVWCNDFYDWHVACVKYYVNNIPTEFDVIIPR